MQTLSHIVRRSALVSSILGATLPAATYALTFDANGFGSAIGLGSNDPVHIAKDLTVVLLSLLGILLVILIIYAGFLWMTAAGNDDKVGKAQSILKGALIGLLLILAAYGIAQYVFNQLVIATSQ